MASKRQTTMAKIAREQAVRERRLRKQEKREQRRLAKTNPEAVVGEDAVEPETEERPLEVQ